VEGTQLFFCPAVAIVRSCDCIILIYLLTDYFKLAGDARSDLLASIRSSGGVGQLRRVDTSNPPPVSKSPPIEEESGGGADLASALAAALKNKRKDRGESDDEDSEDSEWE
jgi:hypothetical protein